MTAAEARAGAASLFFLASLEASNSKEGSSRHLSEVSAVMAILVESIPAKGQLISKQILGL